MSEATRLILRFGAALACVVGLWACTDRPADEGEAPVVEATYVRTETCATCHAEEAAAWRGSDHDQAMDPATPETVLGDFDGATYTHFGTTTRFFREGDRFLVETEGPDGEPETYEVAYTFGVRPLQQYLIRFDGGRLQALTTAWDTEKRAWFSLYPDQDIPAGDWLHWTGRGMTWNYMCADCHSTDLQKNYDLATDTYETTWEDIDVGCEACHGPGSAHVAWAEQAEGEAAYDEASDLGLRVRLAGPEHARTQIETCAPCHSRRRLVAAGFTPGDAYLDHYTPELLENGLYHADGQILDEVYVYGSFLQSKMYKNGVRCADCHDPHSARLKFEGNALCGQCHQPATYDTPEHHFHPEESDGAQCVDCHMPERTYMVVDPRRDHSFKVPRPDLSVDLGTPNACVGCHDGRSDEWARDRIVEWYGPERNDSLVFARALAAGRAHAPGADSLLADLATDPVKPTIARATAAELLIDYDSPVARTARQAALQDPEPLVRVAGLRGLEYVGDDQLYELAVPLLHDSVRAVRIEAGRVLARIAPQQFAGSRRTETTDAFWNAFEEYRASQRATEDQPEAHLNLALLHEQIGETVQAGDAYRTALRLDSSFVPAHVNLAMLENRERTALEQAGRTAEARQLMASVETGLRRALRLEPESSEVHYTLGLLLAEDPARLEEAADHLAEAARLNPTNARIQYNAGLALQHLERRADAEPLLRAAYALDPQQPDFANALAVLFMQQQRWPEALAFTDSLRALVPGAPQLDQQRAYILEQMNR